MESKEWCELQRVLFIPIEDIGCKLLKMMKAFFSDSETALDIFSRLWAL